ncbi:PRD domain-containing protein [Mammaliicoccus sciuri]|nr:PRD domain-containing protein [Mammaliicoccus sciuri]
MVRYHFNLDISEEELSYARFITHLKFFSQRLINSESLEEVMDISLLSSLQKKYSESNRCVDKIGDFLKEIIIMIYLMTNVFILFYISQDY